MATRGSTKALSVTHEDWVAAQYGGARTASSGASDGDLGDVSTPEFVFECKQTGGPGRYCRRHEQFDCALERPTMTQRFEKVAEEAYSVGKKPKLALRYYDPTNFLADRHGWVDLVVQLVKDDV